MGIALLPLVAQLLLFFFCARMGPALGAVAGCGAMTGMAGIGIGGAEGLVVESFLGLVAASPEAEAHGEDADGCPGHGGRKSEGPVRVRSLEMIELIQENGGIEFAIVPGPESLHSLMDCLLFPVVE